jgi:hypothetical protein
MTSGDRLLESRIKTAEKALIGASNSGAMRTAYQQMADLIAQRSADYVRELERKKGLTRA